LTQDQYNDLAGMVDAGLITIIRSGGVISGDMIRDGSLGHLGLEIPTCEFPGDADITLTLGLSESTVLFEDLITQNRTVTLATTDAVDGAKFSVSRSGLDSPSVAEVTTISGITAQASLTGSEYFTLNSSAPVIYDVWYAVDAIAEESTITCLAASTLVPTAVTGKYFTLSSTAVDYYGWYQFAAVAEESTITCNAASTVAGSDYFTLSSTAVAYYGWYLIEHREVTTVACTAGSTLAGGESFTLDSTAIDYYLWYTVDAVGVDPTSASTAIGAGAVALLSTDTDEEVATKIAAAIDGQGGAGVVFTATVVGNLITIVNTVKGVAPATADVDTGFVITRIHVGAIDEGADPTPAGTAIPITLSWENTADQVATVTAAALNAQGGAGVVFIAPAPGAAIVTVTNTVVGLPLAGAHCIDFDTGFAFATVVSGHDITVDPAPGGTGIVIAIGPADANTAVATATAAALNAEGGAGVVFIAPAPGAAIVTVTNTVAGATLGAAPCVDVDTGFTIATVDTGIDEVGAAPGLGHTELKVNITTGDTANQVAIKTAAVVEASVFGCPVPAGSTIVVTNDVVGAAVDAADGLTPTGFTVVTTIPGYTTGAWTVDVGGLKSLLASTWCEVVYSEDAAAWYLSEYGAL